ncbi:MAG: hypothetical protein IPP49_20245 [Saprospiraceae bacterium]|nr:hypothetical protein [Saprospiraceae bacterium]
MCLSVIGRAIVMLKTLIRLPLLCLSSHQISVALKREEISLENGVNTPGIWIIAGHLFTVVDACVDRHLMDFDVSQDISGQSVFSNRLSSNLMAKAVRINLNTYGKTSPNPLFISQPLIK